MSEETSDTASQDTGVEQLTLRERPELLTDYVYDSIRKAILQRKVKPGERVTEASLAARLSVSKTPVREAILRLRRIGLIVDWGKRGGSVIEPSRDAFLDVSEAREAIETYVACRAATRATSDQKRAIWGLALESATAAAEDKEERFHEINVDFHQSICLASGNRRMADMLVDVLDLNALLRKRDLPPLNNLQRLAQDHLNIANAIAKGDGDEAEAQARHHVLRAREENLEIFDRLQRPQAH